MPGQSDLLLDVSDIDSPIQSRVAERDPVRGILVLFAASALLSLSVGPLISLIELFDSGDGIFEFVVPISLFFSALIMIGFAFAIPLLWFQRIAKRCFFAFVAPTALWLLLLGGFVPFGDMDGESWLMGTSLLLLGCVGASIPLGLVMWLLRWRICVSGSVSSPVPVGIIDLMVLTALGAGIFAFLRQWGPFGDESIEMSLAIIIVAFYGLIGSVIASCLLLVMRMFLGVDRRPFCRPNLIGMALTVGLISAAWALPVFTEGGLGDGTMHPVLLWFILTATTCVVAAATAFGVCWWLRRYGFRLNTAAIERAKRNIPQLQHER